MDEQFYIDYFQNLAYKLKAIGPVVGGKNTFFVIDDLENMRELLDAIKTGSARKIMLLELFDDALNDFDTDNNQVIISGAFAILIHVSGRTGEIDRRTAKIESRTLARKIKHKMKWDNLSGQLSTNNILCKIKGEGFAVGPVAGSYFGWRYTFEWRTSESIALIPEDWHI